MVTTVDPCVPIELPRFRRLLSVELGTSIDYQREAPREPGRTWVHLSCVPAGILLQLEDGVTRKAMMRVLDLEPIDAADRTRLLALAVAEFVVASWVELSVVARPAVQPAGAPPDPSARRVAVRAVQRRFAELEPARAGSPRPDWQLGVGVGLDTFSSHAGLLPTVSLRLSSVAWPALAFMLGGDLGLMHVPLVRRQQRVGSIDALRATALVALLLGRDLGDVSLAVGPGVRFGLVRMTSSSRVPGLLPADLLEPHAGVLILTRIAYRFSEHFSLGFELEVGLVTLAVQGTVAERSLLELSGAWLSAGARASLGF